MKFFGAITHNPGNLFQVCFRDIHIRLTADIRPALHGGFLSIVRGIVPTMAAGVVALFCLHFAMPELHLLGLRAADNCRSQLEEPGGAEEVYEVGRASWYGSPEDGFEYRTTACGEIMDPEAWTCAHKSLPFGTIVLVENLLNRRATILRVNDRGPYINGRVIDLSRQGAAEIGLLGRGVAPVRIWLVNGVLKGHVKRAGKTAAPAPQPKAPAFGDAPIHNHGPAPFRGLGDMSFTGYALLRAPHPSQDDENQGKRTLNRRIDPFINREV